MPGTVIVKQLGQKGPNEIKSTYKLFDTRGGQDQLFGRNDQGEPNVLQRPNSGLSASDPRSLPGFTTEGFTDPAVKSKPATGRARGSNEVISKANNKVSSRGVNTPGPNSGGKVKRVRATGAKAAKAKSILSNNPSDDKLG